MLLLGAAFTSEYAIEGAALCNPSMVAHPDQTGTAAGSLRFVMSVRGIGEGHRSSIGFRTGVVDAAGGVTIDDPAPFASRRAVVPTLLDAGGVPQRARAAARRRRGRRLRPRCARRPVHPSRPRRATRQAAEQPQHPRACGRDDLADSDDRRPDVRRRIPDETSRFPSGCCGRRWAPRRPAWRTRGSSASSTTTARSRSTPPTPPTADPTSASSCWRRRTSARSRPRRWSGRAAANKGLALFPRRIRGRFAAMSRSDRESNSIAYLRSSVRVDRLGVACQRPARGVGGVAARQLRSAHRNRSRLAGAHPRRRADAHLPHRGDAARSRGSDTGSRAAAAAAAEPRRRRAGRLRPQRRLLVRRAWCTADTLVLPYGIGDAAIGVATVPLPELLDALER